MGISFHRGPAREPGKDLIYWELRGTDDWGSRNAAFLSEEAECRGPLGGSFTGDSGRYVKKGPGYGHLHTGPIGEPGGDSLAGTFEKRVAYLGSFLRPKGIKILSMGAIWKFSKRTGLS